MILLLNVSHKQNSLEVHAPTTWKDLASKVELRNVKKAFYRECFLGPFPRLDFFKMQNVFDQFERPE